MHSMGTIQARRNFVRSTGWDQCYQAINPHNTSGQVPVRANLANSSDPVGTFQTFITGGSTGYLPTQSSIPFFNGASGWNP